MFDSFGFDWTLLRLGPNRLDATRFTDAARDLGMRLRVVDPDDAGLLEIYSAPLVLVRPDQIVAWRGRAGSAAEDVLARVTGR